MRDGRHTLTKRRKPCGPAEQRSGLGIGRSAAVEVGAFVRHTLSRRNRNALAITETELSDIAAPTTIGSSRSPNAG